jgi:hypothetical protein
VHRNTRHGQIMAQLKVSDLSAGHESFMRHSGTARTRSYGVAAAFMLLPAQRGLAACPRWSSRERERQHQLSAARDSAAVDTSNIGITSTVFRFASESRPRGTPQKPDSRHAGTYQHHGSYAPGPMKRHETPGSMAF